jgi:starvation-inducible DNA-binding protein
MKLFEIMYLEHMKDIDEVAERIRALDSYTIGTYTEYLKMAELKETPKKFPNEDAMVKEILQDHETMIRNLRESSKKVSDLGDDGTEDMLIELMKKQEKHAWMLRSIMGK